MEVLVKISKVFFLLFICGINTAYAQKCNSQISFTAPNSRYELLNHGSEVKDKQTGLIWQRCSVGQAWDGTTCQGYPEYYGWTDALKQAKQYGQDWRVPNINELFSLLENACHRYAINETIFPMKKNALNAYYTYYWSSSPSNSMNNSILGVSFMDGSSGELPKKNGDALIRAVRTEN